MMHITTLTQGLVSKLILLVAIPLIAFLVCAGVTIHGKQKLASETAIGLHRLDVVQASTVLVNLLQRERGLSATFLSGGIELKDLDAARAETEAALSKLEEHMEDAQLDSVLERSIRDSLKKRSELLRLVQDRGARATVVAGYSALIGDLLAFQIDAGRGVDAIDALIRISLLENSKENAGRLRATLTPILTANQPLSIEDLRAIVNLKAGVDTSLNAPALLSNPETMKKIREFSKGEAWTKVNAVFAKVVDNARGGDFGEDPKKFFATISGAINEMSKIIDGEYQYAYTVTQAVKDENLMQSRIAIGTAVATVVVIFLALWFVTRAIMGPVEKIVADLSGGAKTVRFSSGELSSASEEMAASSNESAASLEETVASLEEISATISLSSKRAQEASSVAEASAAIAKEGEQNISDLIARMQEIAASSRRIEEIINVIDDIAFQTNLLALNAAVEAARAGEQGRGFAVVAEAVRNLAQRSGEAAKDINQLIRDSVHKITLGSKTADQSGDSLHRIVESVEKVSTLVHEIAAGNREQAEGVSQISKAMNQLDQATQQNAATSERVSSSAREMSEQADAQQATVDELRKLLLGNGEATATHAEFSERHSDIGARAA